LVASLPEQADGVKNFTCSTLNAGLWQAIDEIMDGTGQKPLK